jgi:hypothetical protein
LPNLYGKYASDKALTKGKIHLKSTRGNLFLRFKNRKLYFKTNSYILFERKRATKDN